MQIVRCQLKVGKKAYRYVWTSCIGSKAGCWCGSLQNSCLKFSLTRVAGNMASDEVCIMLLSRKYWAWCWL